MSGKIFSFFIVSVLMIFSISSAQANYQGTDETNGQVDSIKLTGSGSAIAWTVDGYSGQGFKVVWSKNASPTYPCREGDQYHYYSEPDKKSDTLDAFSGSGNYHVRVCEYLGGKCGVYSNEITVSLGAGAKETVACTMDYNPVCGADGKTYSNKCMLDAAGVSKKSYGECPKDAEIVKIEDTAGKLADNKLDQILAELESLRNLVREQQNEIKYLKSLLSGVAGVTESMHNSLNSFITYGTDDNTKGLGEGERAAVVHSYKAAYGRLPEDETDLADVIKIANGRWPSESSEEALEAAKNRFYRIYRREPDMESSADSAAVTIMAYGLRQKPGNRNLESEKQGIAIFRGIYGRVPQSTDDWNAMQAITYSGATR